MLDSDTNTILNESILILLTARLFWIAISTVSLPFASVNTVNKRSFLTVETRSRLVYRTVEFVARSFRDMVDPAGAIRRVQRRPATSLQIAFVRKRSLPSSTQGASRTTRPRLGRQRHRVLPASKRQRHSATSGKAHPVVPAPASRRAKADPRRAESTTFHRSRGFSLFAGSTSPSPRRKTANRRSCIDRTSGIATSTVAARYGSPGAVTPS